MNTYSKFVASVFTELPYQHATFDTRAEAEEWVWSYMPEECVQDDAGQFGRADLEIGGDLYARIYKMRDQIVNLTPHALGIQDGSGAWHHIEPSGQVARVAVTTEEQPQAGVFSVTKQIYGAVEGLPEPQKDTIYIVSGMVLARVNRPDVFSVGEAVRDNLGRVIGAVGLSSNVNRWK